MERVLEVINGLVTDGVIETYAIGGAMAAVFYAEPVATFDLAVFVAFKTGGNRLISLAPLYTALRKRGYLPSGECIDIEGVPVQFLPAYNRLVEEALETAVEHRYADTPVRIMQVEYLVAIALQTGRPKDRARVELLRSEAEVDSALLDSIMKRYGLSQRWGEWTK